MAISAYNGSFSIARLRDYGISERSLNEILSFCIDEGLLYKGERDWMFITKKGFKHYGALFSLFYASHTVSVVIANLEAQIHQDVRNNPIQTHS